MNDEGRKMKGFNQTGGEMTNKMDVTGIGPFGSQVLWLTGDWHGGKYAMRINSCSDRIVIYDRAHGVQEVGHILWPDIFDLAIVPAPCDPGKPARISDPPDPGVSDAGQEERRESDWEEAHHGAD